MSGGGVRGLRREILIGERGKGHMRACEGVELVKNDVFTARMNE